jgi:hypothetical protein
MQEEQRTSRAALDDVDPCSIDDQRGRRALNR